MGNKDKANNKIDRQKCVEYQLKLRELAYNLLNSKTIFELDQNRLIAQNFILSDKILKNKYDNEFLIFSSTYKTLEYKNAIDCIYENIQIAIKELTKENKKQVKYFPKEQFKNYRVIIQNSKGMVTNEYTDAPYCGAFESCLYTSATSMKLLEVYESLYDFYSSRGVNVISKIPLKPSLYNMLTTEYDIVNFNKSVDFVINNSKIEYFLAFMNYESLSAISTFETITNSSSKFKIELISTALCQVLQQLDQYIVDGCVWENKLQTLEYDLSKKKIKISYNLETKEFTKGKTTYSIVKRNKWHEIMVELSKNNRVYSGKDNNICSLNTQLKKELNLTERLIINKQINYADYSFEFL